MQFVAFRFDPVAIWKLISCQYRLTVCMCCGSAMYAYITDTIATCAKIGSPLLHAFPNNTWVSWLDLRLAFGAVLLRELALRGFYSHIGYDVTSYFQSAVIAKMSFPTALG